MSRYRVAIKTCGYGASSNDSGDDSIRINAPYAFIAAVGNIDVAVRVACETVRKGDIGLSRRNIVAVEEMCPGAGKCTYYSARVDFSNAARVETLTQKDISLRIDKNGRDIVQVGRGRGYAIAIIGPSPGSRDRCYDAIRCNFAQS